MSPHRTKRCSKGKKPQAKSNSVVFANRYFTCTQHKVYGVKQSPGDEGDRFAKDARDDSLVFLAAYPVNPWCPQIGSKHEPEY